MIVIHSLDAGVRVTNTCTTSNLFAIYWIKDEEPQLTVVEFFFYGSMNSIAFFNAFAQNSFNEKFFKYFQRSIKTNGCHEIAEMENKEQCLNENWVGGKIPFYLFINTWWYSWYSCKIPRKTSRIQ